MIVVPSLSDQGVQAKRVGGGASSPMYACMYVCMHVCHVCVRTYICMYVCLYCLATPLCPLFS